jgi:carboxyl-terminal processing protease
MMVIYNIYFILIIMKKFLLWIVPCVLLFGASFATNLNFEDFLTVYFEWVSKKLDSFDSSKCDNIDVKYSNINKWTQIYNALQKWVCLNLFPNLDIPLPLTDYVTQDRVINLLSNNIKNQINYTRWSLIDTNWTKDIIDKTVSVLWELWAIWENASQILDDVKYRLENQSIYGSGVNRDDKKCTSISGCVNLIKDEYTEFYDKNKAQDLYESLEWEFEWIWAYIGTDWNWIFGITSIIEWWPADKVWLKAWDIFLQIDDYVVWRNTTIDEISVKIKWKWWTYVNLKIQRWNQTLNFNIKRELVSLPNVDYQVLDWWICLMSIKQFNSKTLDQFEAWLRNFQMNGCKVYLFDLRDNAWWELNTVVNMLNHFVDSGNTIVQMRYNDFNENIVANWYGDKIKNKSIFMFVNEMTASASEIFVWTIKDYVKNSVLVWSKTYWKWSAQTLVEYADGSILKYTIAKRFTWKSNKNIDWVGFAPDVSLSEDRVSTLIKALKSKK